jgi:8-oxo-dGTP pyrophosphatase MutT (NUDIX family)
MPRAQRGAKSDVKVCVTGGTGFNAMRQSEAAVALIRRRCTREGQALWLARWNGKWGSFHFVSGHKRPDESYRACLVRELAEELGLREGDDYSVADRPPYRVEFSAWSTSARAQTRYIMELFDLDLTPEAQSRVSADPGNQWLTEAVIAQGNTSDARPISPTMQDLLEEVRSKA